MPASQRVVQVCLYLVAALIPELLLPVIIATAHWLTHRDARHTTTA